MILALKIAIITSIGPGVLGQYIGAISDEELKPVVANLIKRFCINTDNPEEYFRFTNFLQEIQDAHDNFTVGLTETKFNLDEFISIISVLKY